VRYVTLEVTCDSLLCQTPGDSVWRTESYRNPADSTDSARLLRTRTAQLAHVTLAESGLSGAVYSPHLLVLITRYFSVIAFKFP
jgi:hypothetical protein